MKAEKVRTGCELFSRLNDNIYKRPKKRHMPSSAYSKSNFGFFNGNMDQLAN